MLLVCLLSCFSWIWKTKLANLTTFEYGFKLFCIPIIFDLPNIWMSILHHPYLTNYHYNYLVVYLNFKHVFKVVLLDKDWKMMIAERWQLNLICFLSSRLEDLHNQGCRHLGSSFKETNVLQQNVSLDQGFAQAISMSVIRHRNLNLIIVLKINLHICFCFFFLFFLFLLNY